MTTTPAENTKTSSPDYPSLAKRITEASEVDAASKLASAPSAEKLPSGLYVVATPIGNLGDITLRALMTLAHADRILCEDTRTSGAMLARYGIKRPLLSYNDHNADQRRPNILQALAAGDAIALISDAGMPLIADPGFKLVRDCREAGHNVTVIPGANAAVTALAGSALPTDQFYFAGFLPPRSVARQKVLQELKPHQVTLIFYEAPQRLTDCLSDMAAVFGPERPAAVARELTKFFEETRRASVGELATFYQSQIVKGEIVILIGPGDNNETLSDSDLDVLLREQLQTLSVRDATAMVALKTGVKKSMVYERAILMASKR